MACSRSLAWLLLGTLALSRATAETVSQTVVLQLKYGPGTKMPDADTDQYHTKAFFASSVEWFLTGMLSTVEDESKFSRLQIYRVSINNQVVGKPGGNQVVQAESRSGNSGGRSLLGRSTLKRQLTTLLPLYVNMTITGNYAPTSSQPSMDPQELEEVVLHLFNEKGGELIEKLQDLTAVPYFQDITQIRAVSASSIATSSHTVPIDDQLREEEAAVARYKKIAAIASISVGAVGILLLSAIAFKIYKSRDIYQKVNTQGDATATETTSLPPPPYYPSSYSQSGGMPGQSYAEQTYPYAPSEIRTQGSWPTSPSNASYNAKPEKFAPPKPQMQPIVERDDSSPDFKQDIPRNIGVQAPSGKMGKADDTMSKASSKRSASSLYAKLKPHNYDGVKRLCFAPPGKLGVAIEDGPSGVGPVVHKIRPGSALEGILKPGDRLVAIDEIDTSVLAASEITQIMSDRSNARRKISYYTLRSGKLT